MADKNVPLDPSHELEPPKEMAELEGRKERPQIEVAPPPLPEGVVKKAVADVVYPARTRVAELTEKKEENPEDDPVAGCGSCLS